MSSRETCHFDSTMIMNGLPLHLLEEILSRLDPASLAMMRSTNKYWWSYLSDHRFVPGPCLFNLFSYGATRVHCQPLDFVSSSCGFISNGEAAESFTKHRCYILGSCSGLLLLYVGGLFVANPLTKEFRLLDHSGSRLLPAIVASDGIFYGSHSFPEERRSMCVGFAVNPKRTTKRFKIVCILEMQKLYGFEISDGDSWRVSESTIAVGSESDLMVRAKPVYLDDTLHWMRNDGSIIAFNPETEHARFIPSVFHREPETKLLFASDDEINGLTLISGTREEISVYTLLGNHKWALARRIKNVAMEESQLEYWNVVAYDGKRLVVWEKKKKSGVVHVYDMEANSWGVLGSTIRCPHSFRDFYKFTPSYFSIEEDEQKKVTIAPIDQRISSLTAVMELIETMRYLCWINK